MENYKNRKTFFVKHVLNGTASSFQANIDIPFAVDAIIIKQVLIANTIGTNDCYSVNWSGIGDLFIFDYSSNGGFVGVTIFTNNKQIQGAQTFYLLDGTNALTLEPEGSLGFVFEAIQF